MANTGWIRGVDEEGEGKKLSVPWPGKQVPCLLLSSNSVATALKTRRW